MTKTVLNDKYTGLVDTFSIPAEILTTADGKKYATCSGVVPIHCCDEEKVKELSALTHHYCDVFSKEFLAPIGDIIYVRIDETTAEKVFVNRTKRLLIWSSDGYLAIWRCAPTFESTNDYIAGTPIVNKDGQLVSVVTARKGNHYAVSNFEGEGGYFETKAHWKVLTTSDEKVVYGDRVFNSREEVKNYVKSLPSNRDYSGEPIPVIHQSKIPRICLMSPSGHQISHNYLYSVITETKYL